MNKIIFAMLITIGLVGGARYAEAQTQYQDLQRVETALENLADDAQYEFLIEYTKHISGEHMQEYKELFEARRQELKRKYYAPFVYSLMLVSIHGLMGTDRAVYSRSVWPVSLCSIFLFSYLAISQRDSYLAIEGDKQFERVESLLELIRMHEHRLPNDIKEAVETINNPNSYNKVYDYIATSADYDDLLKLIMLLEESPYRKTLKIGSLAKAIENFTNTNSNLVAQVEKVGMEVFRISLLVILRICFDDVLEIAVNKLVRNYPRLATLNESRNALSAIAHIPIIFFFISREIVTDGALAFKRDIVLWILKEQFKNDARTGLVFK